MMNKIKVISIAILSTIGILPAISNAKPPEQIMRANCASCHGDKGQGGTSWIDPSQRAFKIAGRSTRSIKKWVREGRQPEMPSFAHQEISDDELDALATYINTLPGSFVPAPEVDPKNVVKIKDEDPWYDKMQLEIIVGETVKFENIGSTYHPVTQFEFVADRGYEDETIDRGIENDDLDLGVLKGSDSGLLGPNGVYYRTFNEPGVYTFLCKIHPYMRGQIFVDEKVTPPTVTLTTPQSLPIVGGVGEIWVEAQFQDRASTNTTSRGQDGVIQVIDTRTWDVINEIEVGNNPHNIWFKSNGGSAVITNWFDNYLTEIDADTKEVTANYIAGAAPAHITSDHAGDDFYVSIEGSNYVQMFNQRNMRLTQQIPVSGNGPHGIWYGGNSDDGSAIIMTSNSLDNTVSFIDPDRKEEIITIDAGLYPLGAGVNSTGTRGYAGNCLEGSVSIYNLEAIPVLMDTLSIGGCPVQAPVSPDDKYVVVPGGPTVVIDTATNVIVASFNTGKGAHGATFSRKADDSGYYAYVTHKKENYVSVIDLPDDGSLPSHAGDVPLNVPDVPQNVSLFGVSLTGGNGIAANPLPAPWQ